MRVRQIRSTTLTTDANNKRIAPYENHISYICVIVAVDNYCLGTTCVTQTEESFSRYRYDGAIYNRQYIGSFNYRWQVDMLVNSPCLLATPKILPLGKTK